MNLEERKEVLDCAESGGVVEDRSVLVLVLVRYGYWFGGWGIADGWV